MHIIGYCYRLYVLGLRSWEFSLHGIAEIWVNDKWGN